MTREEFNQFRQEFIRFMLDSYEKYVKNDQDLLVIQAMITEYCACEIYGNARVDKWEEW